MGKRVRVRFDDDLKSRDTVDDVTIFIKTYNRIPACNKLVQSIRNLYPEQPIIVINDYCKTVWEDDNMKTVLFDEDLGASRGRNEALKLITTKYAIQLDDDFYFSSKTNIQLWKDLLVKNDLDILGAKLNALNLVGYFVDNGKGKYSLKVGSVDSGKDVIPFDCMGQCLMLNVEAVLDAGGWDEDLNMCEHVPFFWKMYKAGVKTGFTPRVELGHLKNKKRFRNYYYKRQAAQRECFNLLHTKYPDLYVWEA